jgi:hypothetical protein
MAGGTHVVVKYNHLPQIAAGMQPKASDIVKTTLLNIENGSKQRVPVLTGQLRRSIVTRMLGALSGEVGPSVAYGARIEFGFNGPDALGRVYHQAGRPYMVPAAEAEWPSFLNAMKEIANP